MSENNNVVLIMGQLREKENLIKQLKLFNTFMEQGLIKEIYYVTDDNLIDSYSKYFFEKFNVNLILKPALTDVDLLKFDPLIKSRVEKLRKISGGVRNGTIWRQLYDLDYALNTIPDDCRLLRTRTDIYISKEQLKCIFNSEEKRSVKYSENSLFEEKIWVQWYSLHTPFYIHDTAFFGLKSDLRKLVSENINIELAKFYPTVSLPLFFWILPFYKRSSDVKIWLGKYSKRKYNPLHLLNEQYLNCLLMYYKFILTNFYIEYGDVQWALQWEPGVMRNRIWKCSDHNKSIIDNLLEVNDGHKAIESDEYLNRYLDDFEKFIVKKSFKNKFFISKVVFSYVLRKCKRLL